MGHPSVWLGEREPSTEILRWETPALPETPQPQDDGNGLSGWISGGFPRLSASVRREGRQPAPGDALSVASRFLARSSSPSRGQVPQGLKPRGSWGRDGTTEVVPFPKFRVGGTSIHRRFVQNTRSLHCASLRSG